MIIETVLTKPVVKVVVGLSALVFCALLAVVGLRTFVTGILTDERVTVSREQLATGARYGSDSAALQARLAEAEMASEERDLAHIEARALRAVNMSPWNFNYPLLLATVREARGDRAGAEQAMRAALQLAPNNTTVHWRLANLLLRQGKLALALGEFRIAVAADRALLPATLDLLWHVSGGRLDAVNAVVDDQPELRLLLAKFLLGQARVAEAGGIFNSIEPATRRALPESAAFLNALIARGEMELARYSWASTVGARDAQPPPLVWNGGFETDSSKDLAQFDWAITRSQYARPSLDSDVAHSGTRSLRIDFAGRDTTRLDGEVKQVVVVRPGAHYQLECYARTVALITPEGPRMAVVNHNSSADIVASDPIPAGTSDWQRLVLNFVAPVDAHAVMLKIKRVPRFAYDDPTTGTVWFDDFKLIEQDHR